MKYVLSALKIIVGIVTVNSSFYFASLANGDSINTSETTLIFFFICSFLSGLYTFLAVNLMRDEKLVKSFLLCFMGFATGMYGNSLLIANDLCAIWIHGVGVLYSLVGFSIEFEDD